MDFRFRYNRHRPPPEQQADAQQRERDRRLRMRGLAIGLSIPASLAGGPLAGWMIGSWIDQYAGTQHWTLMLIIAGTIAGLAAAVEMLIKLGREA